ncbi:trehalose 6-phosphate phosphatase [Sulfobacillus thermosulfidooxidans DSM 9293]|uniref:Trehalose 6-phosphate phosphatase n=2 Tax=Sulfobacillus thermosulfidooxidans TaxID=28034 RepID=A0A1W1WLZ4_SULTA|nr:trehalose-phosphatase [Sulfobacillus thermosulfidooxidans]PSR29854.1 MAG: trehalose-phosphatase [Sulfobacillus thermosulfidooxidans]SMC07317.1 trehalose 6-phosphate phosphatase [Sulfobacillus thermosulfidooxidans DSM 9293]
MCKSLLTVPILANISQQYHSQSWIWFLDIDGTLLDIAPSPQSVHVPRILVQALTRLTQNPRHRVALVSGRSLQDIDQLFPINGLSKSGNHGAEYQWANESWLHDSSQRFLAVRPQILQRLLPLSSLFPGLYIEDKQYSISVHYRHVDHSQHPQLAEQLQQRLAFSRDLVIYPAKLCWEVRPQPGPTKKDAVTMLYRILSAGLPEPILPIIMGDDRTDEDAFGALEHGITVHIGQGTSRARFSLPSPQHVRELLAEISAHPELLLATDPGDGGTR